MQQFTLKDFIERNSPCFSCNSKIHIKLFSFDKESNFKNEIKLAAQNNCIDIDLEIKYNYKLNIKIYYKNNKIIYNNFTALTKYLKKFSLYLEVICKRCSTKIQSNYLLFDLSGFILNPITMKKESLILAEDGNLYIINNDFIKNETTLIIEKNKINVSKIVIPLMKILSLKNKYQLINKIKTYILYS